MKYIYIFFIVCLVNVTIAVAQTGCPRTTAQVDLSVNNVRARLLVGGDLWWDPINIKAIYEVPNGSGISSIWSGSIWIGGIDPGGQLKVAAQMYRQNGANDFWAGPISKAPFGTLSIDTARCNQFDRFWQINRSDVQNFVAGGIASPDMISWPGNGYVANGELPNLAPFFDANNDGIYDSFTGDYPNFNLSNSYPANPSGSGSNCTSYLMGDQSIWWVFNDIGNIKTETNSLPIGIEIRAQAFAYASADTSINNTTFYKYEIVNRSNDSLNNSYTGIWCDVDLGDAGDDYIGCDVGLHLGYVYNGRDTDSYYGVNPPALGIQFLQGPYADAFDGIDNNLNNIIDESNEECLFSKFDFYQPNNGSISGYPAVTDDYYDLLSGHWLNGQTITYGGDGKGGGIGATSNPCSYMFPGTSDFTSPGSANWTMPNSGILPDDLRFIMSEGKCSMAPGEVNYMSDAVIWTRADSGGALASLNALKQAASEIQTFFSTCFTTVGLNELNSNHEMVCFPNPFHDKINIFVPGLQVGNFSMQLFNTKGQLITNTYSVKEGNIIIETNNFAVGTYIVAVKLTNGKSFSQKLLKL